MDLVIPLNLNHGKKNTSQAAENDSSAESSSPSKPQVLGREQAKKRLLAFAQQWTRTKDLMGTDKSLYKVPNANGTLKYTYIVKGEHGQELSFPAHLIQYTKTHPPVSYCENPHFARGVYQSRKEVLDMVDEDTKRVMYFVMNSSSPSCHRREFPGRYRKWYTNRKLFIGKTQDDSEELNKSYSPHWESDSEDELNNYPDPANPFIPIPIKPPNINIISKIKINQVELPFFDDDEFLDSLMTSAAEKPVKQVKQKQAAEIPITNKSESASIQEEYSTFLSSLGTGKEEVKEEQIHGTETISDSQADLHDPSSASDDVENRGIKRRAPTPDWDEQWRSTMSSRFKRSNGTRPRTPPSPGKENHSTFTSFTFIKNEQPWNTGNTIQTESCDSRDLESKRISLDERLELELGIKAEPSELLSVSQVSPLSNDRPPAETVTFRRRTGFGPKAAPMGAVVFSCPKALPPAPYIPPHMQSLLNLPLVRTITPAKEVPDNANTEVDSNNEPTSSTPTTPDQKKKKDWDKELKNLETIAGNLEGVDETILQTLEEKLLQFESSLLPSGNDSPSPTPEAQNGIRKKSSKRPKRPKTPPITLKEPGKGILVMPRVSLLDDGEGNSKKAVMFADSVRPGYGTSSEDEDDRARTPPLPQPQLPAASTPEVGPKKIKKKKIKILEKDFDPVYDLLPAPPPPPGSPPPHLPQGRSMTPPPSSPTPASDMPLLSSIAIAPPAVESEA